MEDLGRFDPKALAAFLGGAEVMSFDEPEVFAALVLAGLLGRYVIQRFRQSDVGLTRREAEVLVWVARGKTNAEVARSLSIAPGTVKKHLDHIYEKLGVGTRTEAVVKALGIRPQALP